MSQFKFLRFTIFIMLFGKKGMENFGDIDKMKFIQNKFRQVYTVVRWGIPGLEVVL